MKTPATLLAACCLAGVSFAGPAAVPPPPVQPAPAANPLSFLDGKVTFDVQERVRWEIRENNFDFNDSVRSLTDDNWFLNRFRLGVMLKPATWLRVYAQAQDSREFLSGRPHNPGQNGAEGDDAFDLRQGYVEISNYDKCPWGLKIGRQVLEYGDGRLIGPGDWSNTSRSFDAVKLRYQQKDWSLDAFASTIATITRSEFNQSDFLNGTETHREQVFSGLYFSTTALSVQNTDLYVLHLHENTGPLYQPTALGDTNFFTFGVRVKSKPGVFAHTDTAPEPQGKGPRDGKSNADAKPAPAPAPRPIGFEYDFEAAFQEGKVRGLDLTAFAVHAHAGYTFDFAWLPHLGVEYDFGSGDRDPADRKIETFQNLFPSNHPPYGSMDVFSWQNMHDAAFNAKIQPCKQMWIQAEYHTFWLASTDDVWYRSNGSSAVRPLTPAARTASNYAGSELDLVVNWAVRKELTLQAGFAHFFAGDYLKDTGAHDDADFGYVQATIAF